jgi:hypothetical protein
VKALLVYLALGAASIVPVLVTVIYAAVALLEQLAVTPDPSEHMPETRSKMIVPFRLNPRVRAILEPSYVAAGALELAPRRVIDRFLAEGDPRRLYIARLSCTAARSSSSPCRCGCGTEGRRAATITRADPDGLALVIVRSSWTERENVLVGAKEAELVVFRRWQEFHRQALGFTPSWESHEC